MVTMQNQTDATWIVGNDKPTGNNLPRDSRERLQLH